LEAGHRIGDSWRKRWDSLRLFSSALHDGLPGIPFPGDPRSFPTKDEVADYLEGYALKQEVPIRFNARVKSLHRQGDGFVIMANGREYFEAEQVVVATGPYQKLQVPSWAADLDPAIVQIHAGQYKNPRQLPEGDVLVVGRVTLAWSWPWKPQLPDITSGCRVAMLVRCRVSPELATVVCSGFLPDASLP